MKELKKQGKGEKLQVKFQDFQGQSQKRSEEYSEEKEGQDESKIRKRRLQ